MRLKEYLITNCINCTQFAKKNDIALQTLYRIMSDRSITIFTAAKVVEATNGKVDYPDLLTSKEKKKLVRMKLTEEYQ